MHRDEFTDRLSAWLDGEMDAAERARTEAHLAGCEECREALAGLRGIVAAARSLPDREPPADQWAAIARRMDEDTVIAMLRRRFAFTIPQLAAAAIALVLASGGAVWLATRPASEPVSAVATGEPVPAGTLVSFDAGGYQATITELEDALAATRDRLAPETIAAFERSLAAIDAAIEDAIAALRNDPNNPFLVRYLERAMVRKIETLKRATPKAPAQT